MLAWIQSLIYYKEEGGGNPDPARKLESLCTGLVWHFSSYCFLPGENGMDVFTNFEKKSAS
jgi:hypothetical protein